MPSIHSGENTTTCTYRFSFSLALQHIVFMFQLCLYPSLQLRPKCPTDNGHKNAPLLRGEIRSKTDSSNVV